MKKRLLSLVLVLVLLVSLVPVGVFADSKPEIKITKQPESVFVRAGADATFSIAATTTKGELKYVWVDLDTAKLDNITLDSAMDIVAAIANGEGAEAGILGTSSTLVLRGVTKDINIVCVVYVVTGNAWGWLNGNNKFLTSQQVKVAIDNRPVCSVHSLSLNLRRIDGVEPTCAAEGRSVCYICSVCGRYFQDPNGLVETTLEACVRPKLSSHQLVYNPPKDGDCASNSMREYWRCTACGKYFSDAAGRMETDLLSLQMDGQKDPNNHLATNVLHYEAMPADCEYGGNTEYWYCQGCNKYFDDAALRNAYSSASVFMLPKNPAVHSKVTEYAAAAPDCVSYGNTHFWYCAGCNTYFGNAECSVIVSQNSTQIAPLGHSYVWTPHYSGAVSDYHEQKCERCGILAGSASHTGGTATCVAQAVCSECGAPYGSLAPDNHANTELVGKIDATATSTGYTGDLRCVDCGTIVEKGEATPALCNHTADGVSTLKHFPAVKQTCTENGNIEYWECELCHMCSATGDMSDWFASSLQTVIPMTGHSYSAVVTKTENCTEDGVKTFTCAYCSDEYTETIPATGHDFLQSLVPATCEAEGYIRFTCMKCGYNYTGDTLPALGHDYGDWIVVTPTTCTEKGLDVRTCSRCKGTDVRNNDAKGHSYGGWLRAADPTCVKEGFEYRVCSECGASDSRDIPALGHDFVNEVCTRCGFSIHEHSYTEKIVEPTCTDAGYTLHTCRCGDTYTDTEVPALGHSFGAWVNIKAATCAEKGLDQRICSRCGSVDSRELDKLPHSYNAVVVAPTCTDGGYTVHTCVCGDTYTDEELPALGHDFGAWTQTKAPTCTEKGEERCDCSRCDEFKTRDVESLGHSYGEWTQIKAPTCTENGVEKCTCVRCPDTKTRDVDSLGHSFGEWTQTKAPTCTEEGIERCDCTRCTEYKSRPVASLGHSFGDWVQTKAPTCTENGTERCDCTRCTEYKSRPIEALGHIFGDWTQIKAPTCTEQGVERHECTRCPEYENRYIDALGHDFGEWTNTTAPTCTEKGEDTRYCSRCEAFETREVDALGHDFGEWKNTTAPTCTEKGEDTRYCSRCEAFDTREVDALGHDFGEWTNTTAPTCTEKGEDTRYCSRCEAFETREVDATGHHYGEWIAEVPATCTEDGAEVRCCNDCGAFQVRDVAALGHDFGEWEVIHQLTCTEDGLEICHCSRCTETQTRETKAPGHDFDSWNVAFEPTCTEKGTEVRYCWNCDAYEYRELDPTGHNYGEAVTTEPTCTDKGYDTHTCIYCGDSYTDNETEPLGHSFVKGICVRCGEASELAAPVVTVKNNATSGRCSLSWNAVNGATKYEIYRSTSKTGTFSKMLTTTKTSYTNTNAKAGTTYYYKVIAIADNGLVSPASAIVSRVCDCARPVVTGGNSSSSGKCTLSWDAVDGAAKYEIYRSLSKDGGYKKMTTTTKTSYTNTTSVPGISYYYKVRAISSATASANSAYCEPVLCTCRCARPVVTSGNSASSGKCTLTWSAVEGAEKYEIYRATSKTGTYTKMTTTTKTSYTNTTSKAGTTYYYKVKAISSVQDKANSVYSTVVSRTCDLARPSVKITTSSGHPKLTWDKVDGAAKYEVYRATSKTGTYTKMLTTTKTSYTNTSAKAGTVYYYKVIAVSSKTSYANSAYSTPVSIRAK